MRLPIRPAVARPFAALLIGLALVAGAPPAAGADPAKPTNHRSRILDVAPALPDGVRLRVIGGDAFLELRVPRGRTAMVPDYGEEGDVAPYLRFRADGTVERNERSLAATVNESRYGASEGGSDPSAPPRWTVVARDGTYAWHDHRIHWMAPGTPPPADERGRIDLGGADGTWTVELLVEGRSTTVTGELRRLDAPSPLPWWGAAAVPVVAAAAWCLRTRRTSPTPPYRVLALGVLAVAVLATWAGWATWRAIPADAGGTPVSSVVPAVGLVAALMALVVRGQAQLAAVAVAAAALVGWAAFRLAAFSHAVLPTSIPFAWDRLATAMGLGTGVALAVLVVWRPPGRRRARRVAAGASG